MGGPKTVASGGAKNFKKAIGALVSYCRKYAVLIAVALVFAAVSAVFSVIGPDYISQLTETITNGISPMGINIDMQRITGIAMTLIAIYAVSMLLGYLQSLIMTHVSCNVGKKMRSDITGKINRIPLKYFDRPQLRRYPFPHHKRCGYHQPVAEYERGDPRVLRGNPCGLRGDDVRDRVAHGLYGNFFLPDRLDGHGAHYGQVAAALCGPAKQPCRGEQPRGGILCGTEYR